MKKELKETKTQIKPAELKGNGIEVFEDKIDIENFLKEFELS